MSDGTLHKINYLRLSITDRCNLRCAYCTQWSAWEKLPSADILRYEELLRLAEVAAGVGIRKVRVTGGEPLVRRGVVDFIRRLHQIPGLKEICLTTNGVLFEELAAELYATGLRHLNLSLDSLRRERYHELTGSDALPEVWRGLERAASLGFAPLKINCVVLKGVNDDEIPEFALLARDHSLQVRFIEFMPTVSRELWERHFLPTADVRRRLAGLGAPQDQASGPFDGPARICRLPGFKGELGFISSVSSHRCATCNRLRITAAGKLKPCLFGAPELDLRGPLRQGADAQVLARLFAEARRLKTESFRSRWPEMLANGGAMVSIGG